ncbi:MAG: hypothetical protein AB2L09_06355 [Coriobacteriia bacterium]
MRRPLVWYSVVNTGRYALVPPIAAGLLLPAGLLLSKTSKNLQISLLYIELCTQMLLPALAAWWPSFVFKERIEGDGRELLYLLRRNGEGLTALVLGLSYWILLVPFVAAALGTPGFSAATVPLLLLRCLFLASFVFCAAFFLRSGALALVLALLLNLTAMEPLEKFAGAAVSSSAFQEGSGSHVSVILIYAILSIALLLLGEARSRRFTD